MSEGRNSSFQPAIRGDRLPRSLVAIVLLAVVLRGLVAVLTRSWHFSPERGFWAFGYEMGQIAAALARGDGFAWPGPPPEPTAWMPPLYPAVMAAAFWLWGTFSPQAALALELLQVGAAAVTCVLLYYLGARLYHRHAGLWAALLFAVYPPAIHFAVQKIWATSLFTACFLGCVLMCLRTAEHPSVAAGVRLGALLAVTVLLDPTALSAYPFLLAWLWWYAAGERRTRTQVVAATLLTLGIGITPWLIRNSLVFGQFMFVQSNFGHELYVANNENATGYYGEHVRAIQDELTGQVPTTLLSDAERETVKSANEAQRNALYQHKAVDFIAEHPLRFLQLTALRTMLFWVYVPYTNTLQGVITLLIYLTV